MQSNFKVITTHHTCMYGIHVRSLKKISIATPFIYFPQRRENSEDVQLPQIVQESRWSLGLVDGYGLGHILGDCGLDYNTTLTVNNHISV